MRMYERCGGRIGHRRWDGIRLKPWYKRIIISLCGFISTRYRRIYINPVVTGGELRSDKFRGEAG